MTNVTRSACKSQRRAKGKGRSDAEAKASTPKGLPIVIVNGKHLREKSDDLFEVLVNANDPPVLFMHGDSLADICNNKIRTAGRDVVRGRSTRCADFVEGSYDRQFQDTKYKPVNPPEDAIIDVLQRRDRQDNFPVLKGLTRCPIIAPDGTIRTAPGYDHVTGLYYQEDPGLVLPPIPDCPTAEELAAAVALVCEPFVDFPFDSQASFANAIAGLMILPLRTAIRGRVPIHSVDSVTVGTGKGLCVGVMISIATGMPAESSPKGHDEEEWGKVLTTLAAEGAAYALYDNVEDELKSAMLALFVTAEVWKNRLLGTNSAPRYPHNCVVFVTGNNLKFSDDIGRRMTLVRMDAKSFRPYERDPKAFRHPDLLKWVAESRPRLLAAIYTMARAWYAAGCAQPVKVKPLGGFEEYIRVIGGILEFAGIDGFMANANLVQERSGQANADMVQLLANLDANYQGKPFTTRDLIDDSDADSLIWDLVAPPTIPRDARKLGRLFSKFNGRPLREDNLRIESCAEKVHNAVQWRVMRDSPTG